METLKEDDRTEGERVRNVPASCKTALKAAERIGKLHPMSFRTTKELRDRLEEAASKAGRSLTSELEHRLERSFNGEELTMRIDDLIMEVRRLMACLPQFGD